MPSLLRPDLWQRWRPLWVPLLAGVLCVSFSSSAWALITGSEGNQPVDDPGWPKGALAVFNTKSRIAAWEGPPFGGGESHAECRGDTAAFQQVLNDFAKIETPRKQVMLHDGVGQSFWLNSNQEPAKRDAARMDWVFTVWIPDRLKFQQSLPVMVRGIEQGEDQPLATLNVYTGGSIQWSEIKLPADLKVLDERLEAHGYQLSDGVVLEGRATDVTTRQPLKATLDLQRIEPQKTGGYQYIEVKSVETNAEGRWVLKQVPAGWYQLVLRADGYASRIIGYGRFSDQPRWSDHTAALTKAGRVQGVVVDDKGQPLPDVQVRVDDFDVPGVGRYQPPGDKTLKTDAQGRFDFSGLPLGPAAVYVHRPGYVRPGLGLPIAVPADDVKLTMSPSARVTVKVDFSQVARPGGYIVHIEPEGGEAIGKWSGSGELGPTGEITFQDIPPGKYVITGRPNPGSESQTTSPVTKDLQGGAETKLTLTAK